MPQRENCAKTSGQIRTARRNGKGVAATKLNVRESSERKAAEIIDYVHDRIERGEWQTGSRMPTEKALIAQFDAARNTVRKALARLERDGMIERHVGRGTFVKVTSAARRPADDTGNSHGEGNTRRSNQVDLADVSPDEVNEIRVVLEPSVAELVVARTTQAEIDRARECYEQTLNASTLEEYEYWDAELHAVIIAAARNSMLARIYDALNEVRKRPGWHEIKRRSLTEERRKAYDEHHRDIVDALARRDAVALRRALRHHLLAVSNNMLHPDA